MLGVRDAADDQRPVRVARLVLAWREETWPVDWSWSAGPVLVLVLGFALGYPPLVVIGFATWAIGRTSVAPAAALTAAAVTWALWFIGRTTPWPPRT